MTYEYTFISATPLFAKIEEEMKSYFATGMLDSLMFPIWTKDCLDKLGKGSLPIAEVLLVVENSECRLPPDFNSVREARMCQLHQGVEYTLPSYFYKSETYQLNNHSEHIDRCAPCDPCNLCQRSINVVYKTEETICTPSYTTLHLLRPGNISCYSRCGADSPNLYSSSEDTFDINGNKFTTNFRSGEVHLIYYSNQLDEEGTNLIPDNVRIREAIEGYIKYKLFEQLYNQVTDETANQIERKYQIYKQDYYEKFVAAGSETKKKTPYQIAEDIKRVKKSLNKYIIK